MYDHSKQYRCTIIRGKCQKKMDDYLPIYAKIIDSVCPCESALFVSRFNDEFAQYLPEDDRTRKTFNNHRTETAGQLFGMYYVDAYGLVCTSQRTHKFLGDNDQPAFFKDICYKMQFPNGSQKLQTVKDRVANEICIRPNAFLLKTLQVAEAAGITLNKREIGYYILNSLDVLQGHAYPSEIIEVIERDRKAGIERIIAVPGKADSWTYQHINEQLNLLKYANLIIYDGTEVVLNSGENDTIRVFAEDYDKSPDFDVYSYDLEKAQDWQALQIEWGVYFSELSGKNFLTRVEALTTAPANTPTQPEESEEDSEPDEVRIGDAGELYVYEMERKRVAEFNFRLAGKVKHLGQTRGIGFDIQSVVAKPGEYAEFARYIEVKSTKRVTTPDCSNSNFFDTFNLTRNEWVAAQQHKEFYSIYRVYFVRDAIIVYVIRNPVKVFAENGISVEPIIYRVDLGGSAISEQIAQ